MRSHMRSLEEKSLPAAGETWRLWADREVGRDQPPKINSRALAEGPAILLQNLKVLDATASVLGEDCWSLA